jgi:AhpD family alkylhydroperoxidase
VAGTSAHAAQAFGTMMRVTAAAGTVDERTKELIHFALAVGMRCGPCLTSHFKKAREMGLSREQLDEAAWCAVAMGGAPVKMFYQSFLEEAAHGGGAKGCCP